MSAQSISYNNNPTEFKKDILCILLLLMLVLFFFWQVVILKDYFISGNIVMEGVLI